MNATPVHPIRATVGTVIAILCIVGIIATAVAAAIPSHPPPNIYELAREVSVLDQYTKELKESHLRNRVTIIETNMATFLGLARFCVGLLATLNGLGAAMVAIVFRAWKAGRAVKEDVVALRSDFATIAKAQVAIETTLMSRPCMQEEARSLAAAGGDR